MIVLVQNKKADGLCKNVSHIAKTTVRGGGEMIGTLKMDDKIQRSNGTKELSGKIKQNKC